MLLRRLAASRAAPFAHAAHATVARRGMATTFDGDMARLYLNFFDQAESAWKNTDEIIAETLAKEGQPAPEKILDVASGPGEPALTLAKTYPNARVMITDGAEAMLTLAEQRIADQGGFDGRVTTHVMDLNDFSPVQDLTPVDVVTAQFALMFTEDLPGSLSQIHTSLKDGGLLVGTVWEDFHILPLLRSTMTKVLGEPPPPPPINPLSLKDADELDAALQTAGFKTLGRHNETAQIDINLGSIDDEDTIRTCLIPVMPSLADLQEGGKHGDDVVKTAMLAMAETIQEQGMVDAAGDVVVKTSTYRYFVAQK